MGTLTITKEWADGDILLESDLDNIKDDVETFINVTKLDGDNLKTNACGTAQITDNSITTAKIPTSAVTGPKLNSNVADGTFLEYDGSAQNIRIKDDGVRTAKILDANVTAAKLATDSVETAKIKAANVTAAKLATDSVETAKIKAANVTRAKLEALGHTVSSSSGTFTTASGSFVDVTSLNANILC